MSDKAAKSMWLRFFREAGIPQGFDTKYALLFDENRIKKDMLMDINKECLRDMGITAMGDIIGILKHAKQVYEEFKAQAYDIPQPTSTVRVLSSTAASSSTSTTMKNSSLSSGEPKSVIINSQKIPAQQPQSSVKMMSASTGIIKRKFDDSVVSTISRQLLASSSNKTSTIVKLKRSVSPQQREEVPVQKKTRVLPEQEGSYIVKMPEGSTAKTQKILQDRLGPISMSQTQQQSAEKKRSVFSRLGGESRVSSSSDVKQQQPPIPMDSPEKSTTATKSSVFSRLGQGMTSSSSSTSVAPLDRSDFMKTKFEVRQPISLGGVKAHLNRDFLKPAMSVSERINRDMDRSCGNRAGLPSEGRVTSTVSRMRSSMEGSESQSVKARLGMINRTINNSPATTVGRPSYDSRSRSISPPSHPPRKTIDSRLIQNRPVRRPISPILQHSTVVKPRPTAMPLNKPPSSIRKIDSNNGTLSVSRQVVKEERFKNAEGKNMIRKTVMKTVRRRIN